MSYEVHLTERFEVKIGLGSCLELPQQLEARTMMQNPGWVAAVADLGNVLASRKKSL